MPVKQRLQTWPPVRSASNLFAFTVTFAAAGLNLYLAASESFTSLPEWQSATVCVCIGAVAVASLLMVTKNGRLLPPTNEFILVAAGSGVWVVVRVYVNRLPVEDWIHSPPANIAAEVAFIMFICSRVRGWSEPFLVYLTIVPYALYSVFSLFVRDLQSNTVISFCFSLFTCLVIGWWVDGLRHPDQSDHGGRQSLTRTSTLDSPQASSQ